MMPKRDRISDAYLEQQKAMHVSPRGYGAKGARWVSTVLAVRDAYRAGSILDYGAGQGSLSRAIQLATGTGCREYDPAIQGKDDPPDFADLVVCTDVLEHIEPAYVDNVITHLRQLARKAVFVVISTRPANKDLPDGRNAHLIVEPNEWWDARMRKNGFVVKPPPDIHPDKMPGKAWVAVLEP